MGKFGREESFTYYLYLYLYGEVRDVLKGVDKYWEDPEPEPEPSAKL